MRRLNKEELDSTKQDQGVVLQWLHKTSSRIDKIQRVIKPPAKLEKIRDAVQIIYESRNGTDTILELAEQELRKQGLIQ